MKARLEQNKIRSMDPLNRLSHIDQHLLLEQGHLLEMQESDIVYRQGDQDDNANFLLSGSVEIFWGGKPVKVVDAGDKAATQVLDSSGAKRFTVVVKTLATILRVSRSQLEQKLRSMMITSKLSDLNSAVESDSRWPAWKMRLIHSPLFKALPISELKEVLNRMQRILPNAKDIIVQQGELGDYYYVVDEGVCSVSRKSLSTAMPIQIADLGPGEAFGEEALITNSPRNATVTAQENCQLLRLDRQTFIELVHKPLVTEVNRLTADKMIEQGAVWLDVRAPDQFASGSLRGSINIPLTLLRSDYRGLSQKNQYIVCAQTTGAAQIGTLLLKQRGLDAACTRESIAELLQHRQNRKHDSRAGTVVPFPIGGGVTSIQQGNSGDRPRVRHAARGSMESKHTGTRRQ